MSRDRKNISYFFFLTSRVVFKFLYLGANMQVYYLFNWTRKMAESIGERLKRLRKRIDLTQPIVAERLGKQSKVSISDMETGKTLPSINDLKILARLYKTTIDYIITGEENVESRIMRELYEREKELEEIKQASYQLLDNAEKFKQVAERKEKYKSKTS